MLEREVMRKQYENYQEAGRTERKTHVQVLANSLSRKLSPVNSNKKTKPQWKQQMRRDRAARRIYQGIPDFVCFSSDWFGSWMLENRIPASDQAEALFYLGFLVRYGYWTDDSILVMEDKLRDELIGMCGIDISRHAQYIQWLLRAGLIQRHGPIDFMLNQSIVCYGNNPR